MKISCFAVLLFSSLSPLPAFEVDGKKYCKEGNTHLSILWQDGLPDHTTEADKPLCEGTVTVQANGDICIEGRMTYAQLIDELGNDPPIFQPAVGTISVPGQLISGSGNVIIGPEIRYIYDFVTSYKINNVSYSADATIVDNMLAASRGTIDEVCFDSSLRASEEAFYRVTHDYFFLSGIDFHKIESRLDDVGLWFFGNLGTVVEYHTYAERPGFFQFPFVTKAFLDIINFSAGLLSPSLLNIIPAFALTGITRLAVLGTLSTKEYPNPLPAPESLEAVESVQIDAKYDTVIAAIKDGLFITSEEIVPFYFSVVIKQVNAVGTNFKCWGEGTRMAAIDIQAPPNQGPQMDAYIENVVYPKLSKFGDVAIHLGKRSPPNSSILASALDFYKTCGVEIGLTVDSTECYHPICERKTTPTTFQYPAAYYTDH